MNEAGKRIKKRLLEIGETQKKLAGEIGILKSSLSLKISGKVSFSYKEIEGILDFFECTYEEIFRLKKNKY